MTMVSLPNILSEVVEEEEAADEDMSNIQFLAIKEFGGKLRSVKNLSIGTGIIATITANIGKDMYLANAKVSAEFDLTASSRIIVELKINGVVIEIFTARMDINDQPSAKYTYVNIGHKVLAGESIELDVVATDNSINFTGILECFEEDTGESPQIPPLKPV